MTVRQLANTHLLLPGTFSQMRDSTVMVFPAAL